MKDKYQEQIDELQKQFSEFRKDIYHKLDSIFLNKNKSNFTKDDLIWPSKPKEEFKKGEWIYVEAPDYFGIGRFSSIHSVYIILEEFYYITIYGKILISEVPNHIFLTNKILKATPGQIERTLIEVAKHKGFKEGVLYHYSLYPYMTRISECIAYDKDKDMMITYNGHEIPKNAKHFYSNGQWAEIVKEPINYSDLSDKFTKELKKWDDIIFDIETGNYISELEYIEKNKYKLTDCDKIKIKKFFDVIRGNKQKDKTTTSFDLINFKDLPLIDKVILQDKEDHKIATYLNNTGYHIVWDKVILKH
jgi:hypothetical protein